MRGNTRVLVVRAYYPEDVPEENIVAGAPFPLTGHDLLFVAKRSWAVDAEIIFTKTSDVDGGIVVRDTPSDNYADVQIDPADTLLLTRDTTLYCRCDITEQNWTIAKGSIYVELVGEAA